MVDKVIEQSTACYHCGEECGVKPILADNKKFCCEGCRMVYEILNQSGLCDYYTISNNPGSSQKIQVRKDKFTYLDDAKIKQSLIAFNSETQTHVTFYLPQIHCSSCLWLLENLHRLNGHIISSKVNFPRKEVDLIFDHKGISLRQVAELLASIGYEPYISLSDMQQAKPRISRSKIYKLGVAGFCFSNIMLLSFPEYLGIDTKEAGMLQFFRLIAVLLSLPVFFYSATEFYQSAWTAIRHKFLNIDAPIVLAIWVTFGRSLYEVISGTGSGYFDSLSGIVFFMLVGRVLQDKTYEQLNFSRDYTSYFPIAVTRLHNNAEETVPLNDIALNDTLLIHNGELIPADGILTRGHALIDYSFVTGESLPVSKEMGEIVYAGGKQTGSNIEILVIKEVAQSYLTKLWNRDEVKQDNTASKSFVHLISRYFTWIVLGIAILCAAYWYANDPSKIWNSVTAVLIIACPCALLLSNTFTNGNILRILSRNKFYLRNAQTIENIADTDHVVFDKTGTLTTGSYQDVVYAGEELSLNQKKQIAALAAQSTHPLSKALAAYLDIRSNNKITCYKEHTGRGIEGIVGDDLVAIGSKQFILNDHNAEEETAVYVSVEGKYLGRFSFRNHYRKNINGLVKQLKKHFSLSVLSGDNDGERSFLQQMMGNKAGISFHQKPHDKLIRIQELQHAGDKVMMLGDGLNDAGALQQANTGIAVSEHCNNFTPASDAILEAEKLPMLYKFIKLCKVNKQVVMASFIVSILYNLAGIYFAVQGNLSPMIAAILMPSSSLSILLITFGTSNLAAKLMKLK